MAISRSFTFFLLLSHLILTSCSASSQFTPTPAILSEQIKFWSQNVRNKMPQSIINKLSPLTKKDSDLYTSLISKNDQFTADSSFCSLAELACASALDSAKTVTNTYSSNAKTYYNAAVFGDQKANEDPFSFFRQSVLRMGNLVHLPNMDGSLPDRTFLPRDIASKISLSTSNIFRMFPESSSGTTKESIKISLSYCNAKAIQGEVKSCPKSLEEMISFSKSALGGKPLLSLTSKITAGLSNAEMIIKNVKKISSDKIVACHEVYLPFATYFCHSLTSTNLYQVDLAETKSDPHVVNTMVAICHMDTSPWPANHVAFKILKSRPGLGEACHWFTQLDLAWISAN